MTREEAIAKIKDHKIIHKMNEPRAIYISEALDMAIKALEQEPCEDAISRRAVLELVADFDLSMGQVVKGIHNLPSVNPQEPKTGHWILTSDYFTGAYENIDYVECSCCHEYSLEEGDFCPNCGTRMVEP